MSTSDSGPRKRFKDKKRKKGSIGELNLPSHSQPQSDTKKFVLNETIHMQKDVHVGGNILSKLVFMSVLLLLGVCLMYALSQNGIREETNSSSVTRLTNILSGHYLWDGEKEQQNDDIEPEEISEHNYYWDYLFPILSFIRRTYEEPENLDKYSTQEADSEDNLETTEQFESENKNRDDENSEKTTQPEDEDNSKEEGDDENERNNYEHDFENDRDPLEDDQDDDDDDDDEDEAKTGVDDFTYSRSQSSYKFDSYKYDNEDESGDRDDRFQDTVDSKDESNEEECNDSAQCKEEGELDKDDDENNDDLSDNEEKETDDKLTDDDDDANSPSHAVDSREESSDSSNEDSQNDVDEPDRESARNDDVESSHVITKLGVGVALIFVAYTVIIRKWNNYVIEEQLAGIPEHETMPDQQLFWPQDDVNRNVNKTLHEYLHTPSASESEDELAYSPDPREETSAHEEGDSESYTGTSGSDDVVDSDVESSATFAGYASSYGNANITNEYDWRYKDDLDDADEDFDRGKLDNALEKYSKVLRNGPNSVRAKYGIARVYDRKAEALKSNKILTNAIDAYEEVLNAADVPNSLFKNVASRVIDRMQFKGEYGRSIGVQKMLIERFPDDVSHQNNLVVTLLTLNRMSEAETKLEEILRRWPHDGMSLVHYGFTLKLKADLEKAVDFLERGIKTREPGTQDGRFYYHLGDALQKLKRGSEAVRVYEDGVTRGVFPSKYQRSLYNIDRLTARPWWSSKQSTYSSFFRKLEANWLTIRDEALQLLESQKDSVFREEAEQLREVGDWKQFELFSRGVKSPQCDRVPFTCRAVQDFQPASGCRRGQVKFSIMEPGTHVWPHCGPTNCRLRAHLGLVVPANVWIRVANETRTWKEGKVLIFDDSFEHEVWHNGTTYRLILIVDLWHPELTERERKTLSAI